jgi:hypothetical protein
MVGKMKQTGEIWGDLQANHLLHGCHKVGSWLSYSAFVAYYPNCAWDQNLFLASGTHLSSCHCHIEGEYTSLLMLGHLLYPSQGMSSGSWRNYESPA